MADIIQEAVKYYTDKLIRQYNQQSNARATMDAYNEFYLKILPIIKFFENFVNIDEAQYDWQLDTIGKIVGITRQRSEDDVITLEDYYALDADTTQNPIVSDAMFEEGFADIISLQMPMLPSVNIGTAISNEDFKSLIKFKIILNNTKFFGRELEEAIFNQFGNDIRITTTYNEDMLFLINNSILRTFQYAKQQNLLPIPQNVSANYAISFFDDLSLWVLPVSEPLLIENSDIYAGMGVSEPVSILLTNEFFIKFT